MRGDMKNPPEKLGEVLKAIREVYQSPEAAGITSALSRQLLDWDSIATPELEEYSRRIFSGLLNLVTFLESNGFQHQAEDVLVSIVSIFPEYYFPPPPKTHFVAAIDFSLFDEARRILKKEKAEAELLSGLAAFEEHFRATSLNLPLFSAEIMSGVFHKTGRGRAGDFFRCFAEVARQFQDSEARDIVWGLMNQMAIKLNDVFSDFEQSVRFLKSLETVKASRPDGWLYDQMQKNQVFFLRNHCWRNIDEALLHKDYSKILVWVSKALGVVDSPYEKLYLNQLQEVATAKIRMRIRSIFLFGLSMFLLSIILFFVAWELAGEKAEKRPGGRVNFLAPKTSVKVEEQESSYKVEIEPMQIKSRSGLAEYRPPFRPHGRKLMLPEVRHVIFQKIRLDHLAGMNLSGYEKGRLEKLRQDWKDRCEFYECEAADREAVFWDLKIHEVNLSLDARDILESWRKPANREKFAPNTVLDIKNMQHAQFVMGRLKQLGYLKTAEVPAMWNEECNRALLEFKATEMRVMDSRFDLETQKLLFPEL